MTETKWQRNEDWIGTEIDDAFVMVNIDTGTYVALNRTAGTIWQTMAEPVDQPAIERALCEVYDVAPDHCHRSVSAVLVRMQDLRLAAPL